jgi:hypothetical protein
MLSQFGHADVALVKGWVTWLESHGDFYDAKNLTMSWKMIKASLELDMLKLVEREAPGNSPGPVVFAAVVNLHQSLSSSAVRQLTEELQTLKITKEPAENVTKFSEKVLNIALRIQGAGPGTCPHDLPLLVYECYKGCSNLEFASDVTDLCKKANKKDVSVDDWVNAISDIKSVYRTLIVRKEWEAEKLHKEPTEAQALAASVVALQQQLKDLSSKQGSGGGSDTRSCFHCGKTGHIKTNCPDIGKPKVENAGQQGGAGSARRTAPGEGQPHTKTDSDGTVTKWCDQCKKWGKGDKAHLTSEHVKGKKTGVASATPTVTAAPAIVASAPAPAVVAAAAGVLAQADSSVGLRFMTGYLGSIGIPPKKNDLCFCRVCSVFVTKGEDHDASLNHSQCEISKAVEDTWTLVSKKGRAGRS